MNITCNKSRTSVGCGSDPWLEAPHGGFEPEKAKKGLERLLGINPGSTATLATLKPFSIIFKHFQELSWLSHKLSRRRDQ